MRYCGNCGTAFDPGDPTLLATTTCPSCHAAITPAGDLIPASLTAAAADAPTIPSTSHIQAPPPPSPPLPAWPTLAGPGGPSGPPAHLASRSRIVVVVLGGLLLLLGATALMSADWHLLGPTRPPAGAGGQTPGGALTPPGISPAATTIASVSSVAPSSTPTGGPSATATVTPSLTTPTATPSAQPVLLVMPTRILLAQCNPATARFGVKNGGGGDLRWTATASNPLYRLTPTSGTLTGGQQQIVTVSNITSSGQITVAALGASSAPQRVTIICGVVAAG